MLDIIVVGGGPVGLHTAKLCQDLGYRVVVLEEDKEIGKPLKCSGLISRNIEKFFPDIGEWGVIENRINSAVLHSRKGEMVLRKKRAAYVIDRVKLDKKLGSFLEPDILLNSRVENIKVKEKVEVKTKNRKFQGEMVIGCDGPDSTVGRFAGSKETVKGLIGLVKERDFSDQVELFFDKNLIKDGFFWKIPRGETTEYGGWGKQVKFSDLERFFGIKNYEKFGGLIPVRPAKKTYSRRVLLAGGAAGQSKPWSGGGVIYGLTCSRIAARVIEKAFRFNDFGENILKEYERGWKESIGKQIKFGILFRKFLRSATNLQLDLALRTGSFFDYGKLDMDFIL
jgi:digeranylgeranylglycerophospholipid reductase